MKIFCFNLDDCSYIEEIPSSDLSQYDLTKPFLKCTQCNSLAIIAKDDFDPNQLDEELLLSSILKLSKRK